MSVMDEHLRRDPEQLLKQAELEEHKKRHGRLRIFPAMHRELENLPR
jgi:hypothetical protein